MVKRCSWKPCKSDTRYPDRLEGAAGFFRLPRWITTNQIVLKNGQAGLKRVLVRENTSEYREVGGKLSRLCLRQVTQFVVLLLLVAHILMLLKTCMPQDRQESCVGVSTVA